MNHKSLRFAVYRKQVWWIEKVKMFSGLQRILSVLCICLFTSSALAEENTLETIWVDEEAVEFSRPATVIPLNETQTAKVQTVADILRAVPGLEVVRQGGVGQTTSVFIRGARSEDTLVLIDGAEANDAIAPACGFDFSTMSPENIERIEVYRGPQSVRFGAGALGGVINIITKEGKDKPERTYLAEVGSYSTYRSVLSAAEKKGPISYSAAGSYISSKGYSAASERSGNHETDGADVFSGSLKLVYTTPQSSKIEGTVRYADADVEIDSHGGLGGDDPNNKVKSTQLITGLKMTDRFFNDHLKTSLGVYFSEIKRFGRNKPDSVHTTDSSDHFRSNNRKALAEAEWLLNERHSMQFSLSYRDESGDVQSSYNGIETRIPERQEGVFGASASYLYESPTWFFDAGLRADESSKVGSIVSYRSTVGREFPVQESRVLVSYGTGYKLPSLYQLYSRYGDQALKQERSTSLELTLEQKIRKNSLIGITFFESRFEDLIDYNMATDKYFNLAKASSRGIELQGTTTLNSFFKLQGSYTYLEAKDDETGLKMIRRPQNVYMLTGRYEREVYELYAQYSYRGERDDIDPNTFQRILMDSYSLVTVGMDYRFSPSFKVHVRVENIFDEKYDEVAGYGTAGRSAYLGVSGSF